MSSMLSRFFSPKRTEQQPQPAKRNSFVGSAKTLTKDFAERLLQTDMTLVLSGYTNLTALHELFALYMRGVEFYESMQDKRHEYFKIKLQWLMNCPRIPHQQNSQAKVPKGEPPVQQLINHCGEVLADLPQYDLTPIHADIEERITKQVKQELYLNDDKQQVKKMMADLQTETSKIANIINDDIKSQSNQISNRLRQRSMTVKTLHKVNSLPQYIEKRDIGAFKKIVEANIEKSPAHVFKGK